MHSIIPRKKRVTEDFGAKANYLIRLDKLGLCPNFLVIQNNTAKKLAAPGFDKSLKKIVIEQLRRLRIENPIIRSSSLCEDSRKRSFAGMFTSINSKKSSLFKDFQKVWLSRESDIAKSYTKNFKTKPKNDMNIIIQEYIKGDYSGILFYDFDKDEIIIEFAEGPANSVCLGKKTPEMLIYKNGYLLYDNTLFMDLNLVWIKKILSVVDKLNKIGLKKFDAEFVVKNNHIFIVQIRSLTAPVFVSKDFIFLKVNSKYVPTQGINRSLINSMLAKYGFKTKVKTLHEKNKCLLTDYQSLETFTKELSVKALRFGYLSKFYKNIMEYQVENLFIRKVSSKACLIQMKTYLRTLYFIDFLINKFIYFLKLDFEKNKKKPLGFLNPHRPSLTILNLLSVLKFKHSLFDKNEADVCLLKKIDSSKLNKVYGEIFPSPRSYKKSKDMRIFWLQRLIWLHDANNFYAYTLTKKIERLLRGDFPGIPFEKICNIPSVVLKKHPLCVIAKNIDKYVPLSTCEIKPKEKRKDVFPLSGLVACRGNFSGIALVTDSFKNVENITSRDIIIAKETSPSLVLAMAVCRGIITENGGISSHAAIVSRELGKPAVVGVKGCLDYIKTGDRIRVVNGKIFKISSHSFS